MKLLTDKAQKAMFRLNGIIFKHNLPVNVSFKLVDTLIVPILTYGSEIWGTYLPELDKS